MTTRLFQGDCMDSLKEIGDKSVDVLFADAPYIPPEHSKTLTRYKKTISEMAILEWFYKNYLKEIDRVLKDDGRIYLFANSDSYALFYLHLYQYVKKIRCFVWDKIMCSLGYTFRHQHELILYAERPNAKPIKTGTGDIFKFRAVKAKGKSHPAEKPVDLLKHILQNHKNETILDTFMGTGSIGVACKELGLNYIGMELEPEYYEVAKSRIGLTEL